ncbi:MAG: DUF6498-containing protein [Burkholderiaceae bacterium]
MTSERAAAGLDRVLAVASAIVLTWGVLVLGWSPFVVMMLFWFENVVIGIFNVVKMLVTGARLGGAGLIGGVAIAAFFTVHYGLFTAVHGAFVVLLFGGGELGPNAMDGGLSGPTWFMVHYLFAERDGWLAVIAIVLVHLSGLVQWLARTREALPPLNKLMGAPYGRIMILHVTLIASGFLVQALKAPVAGALLLIGLKLAYDLVTLGRERTKAGEALARERAAGAIRGRRELDELP